MGDEESLWAALEKHLPDAIELRRKIHQEPERSGDESITRDRMLTALPGGDTAVKVAETGAVVRIGGPGPSIALRGEMDALPVDEHTGVTWASQNSGTMHACGHDVHLAALVAVCRTLAEVGPPIPVLAVLQPREETYPSGAKDIVDHGVLGDEDCRVMIGAHVQPQLDAGTVACTPGGVNASSDVFEILVEGSAGHAAYPHLTSDALLAMSEIVVALQSVVSRSVDPLAAAVLGVSSMTSGTAANVIAGHSRATGTIRALKPETRTLLHSRITEVAAHTARAHGCRATVTIDRGEPVLENDPELAALAGAQLLRQGVSVATDLRSLGADDFSYFSSIMPAVMLFVGTDTDRQLHSPTFLPTDGDVRRTATALLAGYCAAVELCHKNDT